MLDSLDKHDESALYSLPSKRQQEKVANSKIGDSVQLGEVEEKYPLRWLSAESTPSGMPVFDCRSYAMGDLVVGRSKRLINQFLGSREGYGEDVIEKLFELYSDKPPSYFPVEFSIKSPSGTKLPVGPIFRSSDPGIRWEIFNIFDKIVIVQSYHRTIEYVLDYHLQDSQIIVDKIAAVGPTREDGDDLYHERLAQYLLLSHLHRVIVPHPVPRSAEKSAEFMATFSYLRYGELGYYAYVSDDVPADFRVAETYIENMRRVLGGGMPLSVELSKFAASVRDRAREAEIAKEHLRNPTRQTIEGSETEKKSTEESGQGNKSNGSRNQEASKAPTSRNVMWILLAILFTWIVAIKC